MELIVFLQRKTNERKMTMCTVSIKVNDNLLNRARLNMDSNVDIAEWMQQQIEALLIRIALTSEKKVHATSHLWDNYELSSEVLAMAPKQRHNVYGDYEAELTELLEQRYK